MIYKKNTIKTAKTLVLIYTLSLLVYIIYPFSFFNSNVNTWQNFLDYNFNQVVEKNENGELVKINYISTPNQLAGAFDLMSRATISADSFDTYFDENNNFKLAEDISLYGKTWVPKVLEAGFTLDGNFKTIKNLNISSNSYDNVGLVSTNKGTIQNIYLDCDMQNKKAYYVNSTSYSTAGGICGKNEGKISNCEVKGSVYGSYVQEDKNNATKYVGGICGLNNGTIKFCSSNCDVGDGTNMGGIAGGMNSYSSNITGCFNNSYISSFNRTATSSSRGGIVGESNNGTITGCQNLNDLYIRQELFYSEVYDSPQKYAKFNVYAGGISGKSSIEIKNCLNLGKIYVENKEKGYTYVGGIVGKSSSSITDCFNRGKITSISNGHTNETISSETTKVLLRKPWNFSAKNSQTGDGSQYETFWNRGSLPGNSGNTLMNLNKNPYWASQYYYSCPETYIVDTRMKTFEYFNVTNPNGGFYVNKIDSEDYKKTYGQSFSTDGSEWGGSVFMHGYFYWFTTRYENLFLNTEYDGYAPDFYNYSWSYINNFVTTDATCYDSYEKAYSGGICGYSNGQTIKNCYSIASVYGGKTATRTMFKYTFYGDTTNNEYKSITLHFYQTNNLNLSNPIANNSSCNNCHYFMKSPEYPSLYPYHQFAFLPCADKNNFYDTDYSYREFYTIEDSEVSSNNVDPTILYSHDGKRDSDIKLNNQTVFEAKKSGTISYSLTKDVVNKKYFVIKMIIGPSSNDKTGDAGNSTAGSFRDWLNAGNYLVKLKLPSEKLSEGDKKSYAKYNKLTYYAKEESLKSINLGSNWYVDPNINDGFPVSKETYWHK